ncbi:MAG: hypothetical protein JSS79_08595 [Bacteroidetes bacterium]|nr:hypothetical protein [Bacteroidota bacterium]
MKNILLFVTCLLLNTLLFAQEKPAVKLLAKVKGKSILLRWAPTTSGAWSQGNKYGYKIDRYLITGQGKVVGKPVRLSLTPVALKPRPLDDWKADAKNDYSAIAAQAIYGSSFQVTMSENAGLSEVVNRSRELEQRYSFTLFAADHSFKTAKFAALGFADSTVKKEERYLYRVYVASPEATVKIDTGNYYLGLQDSVGLMPPMNLTAQFADKLVLLRWPKAFVQQQYTSFVIERSEAGAEFLTRNSKPYLNTSPDSKAELFFQALDSLPQNGVEYQYRIRGITPFGELGPESERVSGKGFQTLDVRASISEAREDKGRVYLQWETTGNLNLVTAFYVERASESGSKYERLNSEGLPRNQNQYTDPSPLSTNYYRIKVVGDRGQIAESFPIMVQMVDSIPPAAPQGLKVKIDTAGVTKMSWVANTEKDLKGYHIYRSNFSGAEFSQVNKEMVGTSMFQDSINVRTLTKKIYYKIAAFDKRMNRSPFSQVVEAELPDVVPPMPPSITEIKPEKGGIKIKWKASPSDDVTAYRVERRASDSADWQIKKNINKDSTAFQDLRPTKNKLYYYRLLSVDNAGLKSVASNVVSAKFIINDGAPVVKNFRAEADRERKAVILTWRISESEVIKYMIYRAMGDEPLSLYKTIPADSSSYEDYEVKMNTTYRYRIKSVSKDGRESGFGVEKNIQF